MNPTEQPEIDYSKTRYAPLCSGGPKIEPTKGLQSDTALVVAGILWGICIGLGIWYAAVH